MTDFPPGRPAALARLAALRPARYARTRNALDGEVTRLSPYLRHGTLDLAEARDAVLAAVSRPGDAYKLIQELAWRDYWRRVYGVLGERVHADVDRPASGIDPNASDAALPHDVATGTTGLTCIDAFVADLVESGYVHNHARMWFASYVVHHRRIDWRAGARFYLGRLLDGDPASNSLSWQWVAGTFSARPYLFNRENLERYTAGAFCARCPLARGGCPFDASYAELAVRLFGERYPERHGPAVAIVGDPDPEPAVIPARAVVWTHGDALSDASAARRAAPRAPAIVAGVAAVAARDGWNERRRAFVDATVAALAADERESSGATSDAVRDAAEAVVAFARRARADAVVTVASPDPLLRAIGDAIAAAVPLIRVAPPPFARFARGVPLGRFSRYWQRAEQEALAPTPPS